jgi:hypothetical protein
MKRSKKTIQQDLKKEDFEDKICRQISILYQERQLKIENEKKVFIARFISATKGKTVILKIDRNFLATITPPPPPNNFSI